ncbi:MAG: hypothetical protein OEX19_14725 [Gammaproteobacteria bacterium]|nr:hypothetical protein [Gammaproteobacteria bacterium]
MIVAITLLEKLNFLINAPRASNLTNTFKNVEIEKNTISGHNKPELFCDAE